MKARLLSKLHLSADEFARTAYLAVLFFLLVNGIFFGRNARDSIFLVKVGLASLPYAYMLNAVLAIGSAFVYAMFVDKLDRFKLVRSILLIFITALVTIFFGLKTEFRWFYWATYSIVQVIWIMSLMLFWTFAADFFDLVQSKRIFPLIGMGGLVGMITSGLIAKPLVNAFGTEKLFLAWAVLLGAGLLVVNALVPLRPAASKPRAKKREASRSQAEQFLEGIRNVRRTPLLINMVVLILALWIVFTLIDFQFNQVARDHFTDESGKIDKDALTGFLGIFRSWGGACCLLFQLFITPILLKRVGVAFTMTVHPAYLLFSIGGMVLAFGFWPACAAKFGDHVLLYTATDVAYQLLFNPIPAAQRGRARAFVEGYIKPFSQGMAGVVLLLLVELKLGPQQIAACNLVLAVVWFLSAALLKKNYLQAVVSNLQVGQGGVPVLSALSVENMAATIREMEAKIRSDQPDEISFAVEYFLFIKHEDAAPLCVPLLSHADPSVRRIGCRAVGQLGGRELLPTLEGALRDSHPDVIREALAGIRRIGGEEQLPSLGALHLHPDLSIVAEGVETAAEVGGFDGILGTAELLKRWSKSQDVRELELLASILGRLKIKSFLPVLLELTQHPNPKVSETAIKSLTAFKDERVLPALFDGLRHETLFPQLQSYFSSCGVHLKESILKLYRTETKRRRVKRRLFEAIARNSKWDPSDLLFEELNSEDPAIRYLSLYHLSHRGTQNLPEPAVHGVLRREIEHWIRLESLREHLVDLARADNTKSLIQFVIDEEVYQTRKTLFLALGFLKDRPTVQRIYRNIFYGSPTDRALALEALDNLGLRPWAPLISPLLDGQRRGEALKEFQKHFSDTRFDIEHTLRIFLSMSYEYILSVILYVWRETEDKPRRDVVESLRSHSSGLVRENAEAAVLALGGT